MKAAPLLLRPAAGRECVPGRSRARISTDAAVARATAAAAWDPGCPAAEALDAHGLLPPRDLNQTLALAPARG